MKFYLIDYLKYLEWQEECKKMNEYEMWEIEALHADAGDRV